MTVRYASWRKAALWGAIGLLVAAAGALGGYALSQNGAQPPEYQVAMSAQAAGDCGTCSPATQKCEDCRKAGDCEQCATTSRTPVVDKAKCSGCTLCTHLAPNTFAMDADGKARVVNATGDDEETIQGAMARCKPQAIAWK